MDLLDKTPRSSHGGAFCYYPQVRFSGQRDDEEVVLLLRAHLITQIPWVVSVVGMLILTPFFFYLLDLVIRLHQTLFIICLYFLFIFSYALINFLLWLFNVGIVTTSRAMDFDFKNVIDKESTETPNADITDVTAKVVGFIPSFIDYGNVYIQTAGISQNIEFLNVPQPQRVTDIISRLANQFNEKPNE